MAIFPAPATVLVPALLLNVALVGWNLWRHRPGPRPAPRIAIGALPILLVLGIAAWLVFGGFDRAAPVLGGLTAGVALGLAWEWAFARVPVAAAQVPAFSAGLAVLAVIGLLSGDAVVIANSALGLLAGWATVQILAIASPPVADLSPTADTQPVAAESGSGGEIALEREAAPALALAALALTAGAAAWGEKIVPNAGLGLPLAIGIASALALALTLAALAPGRQDGWLGRAIAAGLFLLMALLLAGGVYSQPATLLWGLAAGSLVGWVAPFLLPRRGVPGPLAALAFMGVVGSLLVLENRLLGILAIGLGGLGLALGARADARARSLVTLAVGVFATRVWLQLFLDRTLLTGYGVDLTHPYAFAALIVGGLLPGTAYAVGKLCRPDAALSIAWAIALALLPAWVGYFIHIEALGSLLAGLVLAAFTLGVQGEATSGPDATGREWLTPVLILTVASTLLAAPWLVDAMNATREARMWALLAGVGVVALAVGHWWFWVARRQGSPA